MVDNKISDLCPFLRKIEIRQIYVIFTFWEQNCTNTYITNIHILKEKWLCENTVISILDYMECFRHKLTRACEIEQASLKQSQDKMKQWYVRKIAIRQVYVIFTFLEQNCTKTYITSIHCQLILFSRSLMLSPDIFVFSFSSYM
jgi:hypothetical protein